MKYRKFRAVLLTISVILSALAACTPEPKDVQHESIDKGDTEINENVETETDQTKEESPTEEPEQIDTPSDEIIDGGNTEVSEDLETETDQTKEEVPTEEPEQIDTLSDEIAYIRQNLPQMDGSTSLILLEMGLKAKIFDISFTEALAMVEHTTTYGAFERLLNKEVDMIFSTPLSTEQYDEAAKKGMDLELVPVAAEAFVFIVNANNPVDSLTQQQIKDIYSGKITNWKEVGGEDIEIVAFQRNWNSGSQNYMKEFMGETQLMQAPTEKVPSAMNSLIDEIKSYNNSQNAIGYSVYAYAADMYGMGDTLKFIKIDGIEPTKESISAKEYPLVNYNYVIYDKNSATESVLRTAKWISSTDGQTAIAEAGYVPYENVQREYLELIGTGKAKAENYTVPTTEFRAYTAKLSDNGLLYADRRFSAYDVTYTVHETIKTPWKISGLANKELEDEINRKLSELEAKMDEKIKEVPEYIELLKSLSDHTFNETNNIYRNSYYESGTTTDVEITVKNGYMCIIAGVYYYDGSDRGFCYHAEGVYYDLINGKEISFTDLFYEGTDIDKAIYDRLTGSPLGSYNQGFFINAVPFSEITRLTSEDYFAMSFDKIYFTHDNPIFCVGEIFEISLDHGYLCADEPNDMKGIFDGAVTVKQSMVGTVYDNVEYVDLGKIEGFENYTFPIRVNFLPETGEFAQRNKKINDYVRAFVMDAYGLDKMYALYYTEDKLPEDIVDEISYTVWDTTFALTEFEAGYITLDKNSHWSNNYGIFDGKTGEPIDYTALLKDGWQNNITVVNSAELTSSLSKHTDEEKAYIEKNQLPPNSEFYTFGSRNTNYDVPINGESIYVLTFGCTDSTLLITVYVDSDYVKTRID